MIRRQLLAVITCASPPTPPAVARAAAHRLCNLAAVASSARALAVFAAVVGAAWSHLPSEPTKEPTKIHEHDHISKKNHVRGSSLVEHLGFTWL